MDALLFLPAAIIFGAFFLNAIVQSVQESARRREVETAAREKAEAAARAKAEREAQKSDAKASMESESASQPPKRKRGRPCKEQAQDLQPAPVSERLDPIRPETIRPAVCPFKGNNAFAGEIVAFTGTLDGMTRAEAIKAVEDNGGRAFETMPAGTTILVVGSNPGMNKLDKADRWIGQVRKITQEQFRAKLALPLTLTPDEFAERFAPRNQ